MATSPLAWMAYAITLLGTREVAGPGNSPIIAGWLKGLKAWWFDDATPWCGVFVAHCLQKAGHRPPRHWYRAKGWLEWGEPCEPAYGAICILNREGGGHVFFVTKVSKSYIWGVGGNQGDKVCEAKFDHARVIGFRWPATVLHPAAAELIADAGGSLSRNEA